MKIAATLPRLKAPETGREAIQLTTGDATCYPLYYFIPSFTDDGRYLVYHRAGKGRVQLHRLDLETGESIQLAHGTTPQSRWVPWCVESGPGILDHRAVLNVARREAVYFDRDEVRIVTVDDGADRLWFRLPENKVPAGQNCVTTDGEWFVYILHDKENFETVYPGGGWGDRSKARDAKLLARHFDSGEERLLVQIDSPIHHVLPYDERHVVFCHPTIENGMLLTDLEGGWYTHMRTKTDEGCVCHYLATARGMAYEVLGGPRVYSGLYDPFSHKRYEWLMPEAFGYTHTGCDPEGLLWFWENAGETHDLRFLVRHRSGGEDDWQILTGDWPTYGYGQKSHFHPRLSPDRNWILFTGGDAQTRTNHLYLLDISDLEPTEGIPDPAAAS